MKKSKKMLAFNIVGVVLMVAQFIMIVLLLLRMV